jgi:2-polyprenyl-6-methoxyphenol hydroxylase-like FAD-dependent oxidoreductase
LRIGIIGCGMAGQAAAIALSRDGHAVTVMERFAEAKPAGAGLMLQPSGLLALERLGLRDAAMQWGAKVDRLYGRTVRGRAVMDLRYADIGSGAYGFGISRIALFKILHDALLASSADIRLGFEVRGIVDFERPRVMATDGRMEGPFDLLIDCGGAHDGLRNVINPRAKGKIYPWGALWAPLPDRSGTFQGELRQVCESAHTMIGIMPMGKIPGDASENTVAFFWSVKLSDYEATRAAGLDALKARILKAWPQSKPIVDEIKTFDQLSLATYRDVHMGRWRKGCCIAIGDASHGTSPQLGQGTNLALIDCITLAHVLRRESDVPKALARFERMRRPHVGYYQIFSRALTPAFQSNSHALGWLRDVFLGPLGRMPGIKHIMRTTLSGVRKFPFGLWKPPTD